MNSDNIRMKSLRIQLGLLTVSTVLELAAALALVFYMGVYQIYNWLDVSDRILSHTPTKLDQFLSDASSEYTVIYLYDLIYPFFCLLLLGCLIYLARANKKNRVIGSESLWVLLLGVSLPTLVLLLVSTRLFNQWYVPVVPITSCWIYIGVFPLNILLIRNLVQYAKAIRKAKEQTAAENPAIC